jgi:hypothetical protein
MVEIDQHGSARSGASSSNKNSNSEVTSRVGDAVEEISGRTLPTRSQLVTFLSHKHLVSENKADSWVTTALMSGRIHEPEANKIALITW